MLGESLEQCSFVTLTKAAKLELSWSGMWHDIKFAYGDILLFHYFFLRKKAN